MKKIAIIDSYFTGSTLPLVRRLIEDGCKVDYYFLTSKVFEKMEAFTFEEMPCEYGLHVLPRKHYEHMSDYLPEEQFTCYTISTMRPFARIPMLREAVNMVQRKPILRKAARHINAAGYDFVQLVGVYWNTEFITLTSHITAKKIVSLHEVCNHEKPDFSNTPPLLKHLFKNNIPIITYSEKSYNDLRQYHDVNEEVIHLLAFGRFETYRRMLRPCKLDAGRDYFMFVGYMKEYKGVGIFAKAIQLLCQKRSDIHFVIAGKGYNKDVEDIKDCPNLRFFNHFIDNDDLVSLIDNSYAIVCPYKTASQSGVPQTAFVFDKPVIATDLKSFRDVLGDSRFGIFCEVNSPESLAEAIEKLWDDKHLHASLTANIRDFDNLSEHYGWTSIYHKYKTITEKL